MAVGKRLGCGQATAYINTVGGLGRAVQLNASAVQYGRRIDEISDARVDVAGSQSERCEQVLSNLEPWYHELSIYRDQTEEWVGPITDVTYTTTGMTIVARDMFQWLERRFLPSDQLYIDTDLSTIAVAYLSDAMGTDSTPNISFSANPCGITGTRAVYGFMRRRAADEIRELSRGGLDFTTIRRVIRFGGKEVLLPHLPVLHEQIFEINSYRKAGLQMANHVIVFGNQPSGVTTPLIGEAGGNSLPLIQMSFSEPSVLDTTSADAAAQTRWDLLNMAPSFVTGRLLEDAPVEMGDLIPGALVQVKQQVGYRRVEGEFRLVAVQVTSSVQQGLVEEVALTLEPTGTIDAV